MKKGQRKGLLLLFFTLLFNYLFWHNTAGVNLLLFTVAINALIFYSYPLIRGIRAVWLVAVGSLLGALATVVFNSDVAKLATIASILLLNGFAMFPEAKSLISAFAATITNLCGGFLMGIMKFYETDPRFDEQPEDELPKPSKWKRAVKLGAIPLAITMAFYFIFAMANPVFAQVAEQFNNFVIEVFNSIFSGWTLERVGFTLLGAYLLASVLYHWLPEFFPVAERRLGNSAQQRENENSFISWVGLEGLKDETLVGVITLIMVNLLILTVNAIDVNWLWFNFNYEDGMDLSSLVHEGTYWLIFSILLSMGVLMYFFRGNQNFNTGNGTLKALTYLWIAQNMVMIISVVLRNYHYIDNHGLTYKRIGVYVFLLMTLIGLVSLIVKIARQRSNFFLWRINAWAAYAVLVVLSFWNWDASIAQYNVHTVQNQTLPAYLPESPRRYNAADKVDLPYLLKLSDKALPALLQHPNFDDDQYMVGHASLKERVRNRYKRMKAKLANQSWLSWNWADNHALEILNAYFEAHPEAGKPTTKPTDSGTDSTATDTTLLPTVPDTTP